MTEKSAHEDVDTGKMVANSDNKSSPGMRAVMWGGGLPLGTPTLPAQLSHMIKTNHWRLLHLIVS